MSRAKTTLLTATILVLVLLAFPINAYNGHGSYAGQTYAYNNPSSHGQYDYRYNSIYTGKDYIPVAASGRIGQPFYLNTQIRNSRYANNIRYIPSYSCNALLGCKTTYNSHIYLDNAQDHAYYTNPSMLVPRYMNNHQRYIPNIRPQGFTY
ncbi:hypothetical protein JW826_05535 [Candidatus Woesearchaeota archaeon]|nr:hypothetical protein [Candidatus Woesearchaeota archaeon]